jgi:type VI secretion system FHA domain protein
MRSLTLTIVRSPDAVAPPPRRLDGGQLSIGRDAQSCDWVLPDPEKLLSRRHCEVVAVADGWQVRDLSSNGTFLNQSPQPVGRDQAAALGDGDRLRLGNYEIEVRLSSFAAAPMPASAPAWPAPAPTPAWSSSAPAWSVPAAGGPALSQAAVPGLDTPAGNPFAAPVADHAPAAGSAFPAPSLRPAAGAAQQVPADWGRSILMPSQGARAAPAWPPRTQAPAPTKPAAPAGPAPTEQAPAAAWPPEPVGAEGTTRRATPPPAPAAAPVRGPAVAPATVPATGGEAQAMLAVAVSGLRALLVSRGLVKREFRIEATVLGTGYNNPLKFGATDEQALQALLDPRADGRRALEEAVADLTLHQVAVLEATQAAARALLERLAPPALEAEDAGGGLFAGSAEKRLWLAYKKRHAQLLAQLEDDFDSAFGIAFARAYEQAVGRGRR